MRKKFFNLMSAIAIILVVANGAIAKQFDWYPDLDGDLQGDMFATPVSSNKAPDNTYVLNHTDCDDTVGSIYSGAPELCDGQANDCNALDYPALPDEELDYDGDGFVKCRIDAGGWFGVQINGGGDCDDGWDLCYPSSPNCECTVVNPVASAGQIWMDRNLGATQVATSSTDSAAYGDLYQWGRGPDGHQRRNSATTTTRSASSNPGHGDFILGEPQVEPDWLIVRDSNLWQGVSGINNPCPAGYRVPTLQELEIEVQSWPSGNYPEAAFNSPLKLPMPGYRSGWDPNGAITYAGSAAIYRSSTPNTPGSGLNLEYDRSMGFNVWGPSTYPLAMSAIRIMGLSVRCIMD